VRVTAKGQVTIPAEIRQRFGFLPDTEVEFIIEDDQVRLVRAERPGRSRGDNIIARLRGRGTVAMSTDEILALTRQP
jgi:AbrB family looped-hinge helix DNA binding protein